MKYAHAKVTRRKDLGPPAPNVHIVNKVAKNGQSALGSVAERLLFRISTLSADSLESAQQLPKQVLQHPSTRALRE